MTETELPSAKWPSKDAVPEAQTRPLTATWDENNAGALTDKPPLVKQDSEAEIQGDTKDWRAVSAEPRKTREFTERSPERNVREPADIVEFEIKGPATERDPFPII